MAIQGELEKFAEGLADKPRWLVINKCDLLDADELARRRSELLDSVQWDGPVFEVSAISGSGTDALGQAVIQHLQLLSEAESELADSDTD